MVMPTASYSWTRRDFSQQGKLESRRDTGITDKQPVRDATEVTGWDKSPLALPLSTGTIQATRDRYITAYERITGRSFGQWIISKYHAL